MYRISNFSNKLELKPRNIALLYYGTELNTAKRIFIALDPANNALNVSFHHRHKIKRLLESYSQHSICFILANGPKQLECLFLESLSILVLCNTSCLGPFVNYAEYEVL